MSKIPTLNFFYLYRNPVVHPYSQLSALAASLACAVLLLLATPRFAAAQIAETGTELSSSIAQNARVLRLSYNANPSLNGGIVASVTAYSSAGAEEDIYSSTDGVKFTQVGTITDSNMDAGNMCCGTLYELPSQVGSLAPGTLLWSASIGYDFTTQPMLLEVYKSSDQGHTWSYLSNCAAGATSGRVYGGLWEPQFTVANDGALVCFYSDEQQAGHSQLIHQVRSYDGIKWQDSTFTVASTVEADRPGMPVVTKLPSGTYFMSYEFCGSAACAVYYLTSTDGWNWGDATKMGTRAVTAAGQWLEHTPTNTWAPSAASANGTILLIGQMMYDSSGAVSSGNGVTIFTNHSADGSGTWGTMPAPVEIPDAYSNYCPNYNSAMLPSVDGQSVLEFASAYSGTKCLMYFGTGPILAGTLTPDVTVTPNSNSVGTAQPVSATVAVSGASVMPVGTVTISASSYTSSAATLSNGSADLTIPANTLSAGTATLTASYSGDANYLPGTGTASVTITQSPSFTISAANLTIKSGASSGNTATITVTPVGGFTGNVSLTAQITSAPAGATLYYPSFSFGNSSPVNITGSSSGTATLTIYTAADSASNSQARPASPNGRRFGAVSLGLIFFALPFCIRARCLGIRNIFLLLMSIAVLAGGISGCKGGTSTTNTTESGTLPGTYVVTITGTAANVGASGSFTLTVQ